MVKALRLHAIAPRSHPALTSDLGLFPVVPDSTLSASNYLAILSPPHTGRKELSKRPREAVCSAVSLRVRGNCGDKFAS